MTLNLFFESRNQSDRGMKAVASVTMQRANHKPENVCKVVLKAKQFSWTNKANASTQKERIKLATASKKKDYKNWKRSKQIAELAISRKLVSPVKDATYFYNPKLANPSWRKKLILVAKIDDHIFMK